MPDAAKPIDASTLDEIFLDLAVLIELSPYDRQVAENRYRRLKVHVERPTSLLRQYLVEGESLIFAQGSIATSTIILSGDDDDKFDVDAIVEADIPPIWSDDEVLDKLFETLQGFPGAKEIVRCTRCVQMQFAFMHMDVTVMDRRARIQGARPGEIFHSPDDGDAYRVPSNPWGFTGWFRSQVGVAAPLFEQRLQNARALANIHRLQADEDEQRVLAEAQQVPLPPAIPSRIDAQQAVALKLLKRFLNLCYRKSHLKKPPSIWLTRLTGDVAYDGRGLTHQLFGLADLISANLKWHLNNGKVPREENPSYPLDKINDRWPRALPEGNEDMTALVEHLDALMAAINKMLFASQDEILKEIDKLFGERFGTEERALLKRRYDRRDDSSTVMVKTGTGAVFSPAYIKPQPDIRPVPQHRFHSSRWSTKGKDE